MTSAMLKLENRAIIRLSGPDARSLLQGLVTNDVTKVSEGKAVYAALLTPQGKYMFDMILAADGDDLLVDTEASRKADLLRRLMMYRLRANVEIVDEAGLDVWASFDKPEGEGAAYPDPRHEGLGWRLVTGYAPQHGNLALETYEDRRIRLGVPDGSRDMAVEKYFWLETGAERLHGVSFTKGCYVGQELTARMKHRTTVKKMLRPALIAGGAPEAGTAIETSDGKSAGNIHSTCGDVAMVYFRQEYEDAALTAEGRKVTLLPLD